MEQEELNATAWRKAYAVWLHEHGLMIATDPGSATTDYPLGADEYENTLSSDLLGLVYDIAGRPTPRNLDSFRFGWTRSYKLYPLGCDLVAVFVRPVPGGIEIKMHVAETQNAVNTWTDLWTYHGAYSVSWPAVDGHA